MNKYNIFWSWFLKYQDQFGENFENQKLIEELDEKVLDLGNFVWEIGPGTEKQNMLVISPGGDVEKLKDTEELVSLAPNCSDWEFYSSKPPKKWNLIFEFYSVDEEIVFIDGNAWEYYCTSDQNGKLNIIIKYEITSNLEEVDLMYATEILLDGIIGEKLRIENISEIILKDLFSVEESKKSRLLKNLNLDSCD